jgi:protocatechuate 3,4-dioxygenase beta subunit
MTTSQTRRRLLALSGAAGILAATGAFTRATAAQRRTASQALGPFYPLTKPADSDTDLTLIQGHRERAQGQVIYVTGRVLNAAGKPLPGIGIELWQANSHGRYNHPGDDNPAPLDPNFQGFARLFTDADGRYRIKTIKPSGYPAGEGFVRPPHIHFDITGRSSRLVTQMYFAGEPLNDTDRLLASTGANRSSLIVTLGPPTSDLERDALLAQWDIVLESG